MRRTSTGRSSIRRPRRLWIGGRALKTCVAIAIAVWIAEFTHLVSPQFAGIVAVLAVQPSAYRSVRQGMRQIASAAMGAALGMLALWAVGHPPWAFGLVSLLLMGVHIQMRWTPSLLVAVVAAINTMGSAGLSIWHSGLNQLALICTGLVIGTIINLLVRPAHHRRALACLEQGQREVRQLLHLVHEDIRHGRVTPYEVVRDRIQQVHVTLSQGRAMAHLAQEDAPAQRGRTIRWSPSPPWSRWWNAFAT
ncbi:hypothetical protein GCM10025857_08920 [Alicyclobacillus contaminans]|nr:hypothetical protein GCM10025857_08920 [Alicyclobacillus contaminans]